MSERRTLRAQVRQLSQEIAKFGAVGGLGVLVNIGVFDLLRRNTDLPMVRAGIAATTVAIVFNYVGFRYFTYRDRDKSGRTKELTLFLLFSGVGLVIENGLLFITTYGFGWDSRLQGNLFKFVGIGVATLFRFWSYRTWVFRALPARDPVNASKATPAEGAKRPAGGDRDSREAARRPARAGTPRK
ncbi:hypothetical protein ACZ90_33735 [Streptomyces albus subsp. albus]|nr:hypothetical protein ACZ90_33735 [Streptomyces albus subsp. albus]